MATTHAQALHDCAHIHSYIAIAAHCMAGYYNIICAYAYVYIVIAMYM